MSKRTKYSLLIIAMFVFAVFVLLKDKYLVSADASSTTTKYITGYAWSSNVGWISFNGGGATPLYDVTYNADPISPNYRMLSGYAWSSNIGWISFGCGQPDSSTGRKLCSEDMNGGDPNYPPVSVGTTPTGVTRTGPQITSDNKLVGFARACSVFASGCSGTLIGGATSPETSPDLGGWDGWISLFGQTSEVSPNQYGISFDNDTSSPTYRSFFGYAWGGGDIGSQVPGWISFQSTGGISSSAYGIKMEDTPPTNTTVTCERSPFPIVGVPVTWTANVIPAGGYSYHWDIGGIKGVDYSLVPADEDVNAQSVTVKYLHETASPNQETTDVTVKSSDGSETLGTCSPASITRFDVAPLGFTIDHQGDLSAAFSPDRGITTYTYRTSPLAATIPLTVSAVGDFTSPVTLVFKKIILPACLDCVPVRPTDTIIADAGSPTNDALIVTPQFTSVSQTTPGSTIVLQNSGGVYESANLRLILTKNQNVGDLPLPSGDYTVIIDSINGGHEHPILLHLSNPTGGIKEK
ncbi:MAG: hypothetical protein HY226_05890 [Candidatus Vogelbacteria bacterium]|nr:hypothetical protein [Candidatus Vogelbacteria bacterium]